jgi:hypothetical protein|tara:strand:- start:77062 stop:77445 length:384 start_codon:yes stop_codon:yes gene_type:complete
MDPFEAYNLPFGKVVSMRGMLVCDKAEQLADLFSVLKNKGGEVYEKRLAYYGLKRNRHGQPPCGFGNYANLILDEIVEQITDVDFSDFSGPYSVTVSIVKFHIRELPGQKPYYYYVAHYYVPPNQDV